MVFHETWMEDESLPRIDLVLFLSVDRDKEMDPEILFSLSLALRASLQHFCSFLRMELDEKKKIRHI